MAEFADGKGNVYADPMEWMLKGYFPEKQGTDHDSTRSLVAMADTGSVPTDAIEGALNAQAKAMPMQSEPAKPTVGMEVPPEVAANRKFLEEKALEFSQKNQISNEDWDKMHWTEKAARVVAPYVGMGFLSRNVPAGTMFPTGDMAEPLAPGGVRKMVTPESPTPTAMQRVNRPTEPPTPANENIPKGEEWRVDATKPVPDSFVETATTKEFLDVVHTRNNDISDRIRNLSEKEFRDFMDHLDRQRGKAEGSNVQAYMDWVSKGNTTDKPPTSYDKEVLVQKRRNELQALEGGKKDETPPTRQAMRVPRGEKIDTKEPAAVQVQGQVFRAQSHADALEKAAAELGLDFDTIPVEKEGFITNKGRFVSREEAKIIANMKYQIKEGTVSEIMDSLFSEDLKSNPTDQKLSPGTRKVIEEIQRRIEQERKK